MLCPIRLPRHCYSYQCRYIIHNCSDLARRVWRSVSDFFWGISVSIQDLRSRHTRQTRYAAPAWQPDPWPTVRPRPAPAAFAVAGNKIPAFRNLPESDTDFLKRVIDIHRESLSPEERARFNEHLLDQDPEIYSKLVLLSLQAFLFSPDRTPHELPPFLREEIHVRLLEIECRLLRLDDRELLCRHFDSPAIGPSHINGARLLGIHKRALAISHELTQGNHYFLRALRALQMNSFI